MNRRLLFVALGLFVARLALFAMLVPPWQQPDEHVHVAVVEMWRSHLTGDADDAREAEILDSMAANGWWRHYTGGEPPTPLGRTFSRSGEVRDTIGVTPSRSAYPPLYYGGVGLLLSPVKPRPVSADLWTMRLLSAVLSLITVWVIWRGATAAAGEAAGGAVTVLAALHPQLGLIAVAASPDAAIILCGATVWWMAVRVLHGDDAASLRWLWVAAVAAAAIDRSGLPLMVIAAGATLLAVPPRRRLLAAVAIAIGGIATVTFVPALQKTLLAATTRIVPVARAGTVDYFEHFHRMLFETWWFAAGWLRYRAPEWVLVIVLVMTLTAVGGLIRRVMATRDDRRLVMMAVATVAVQAAAVYWTYYRFAIGPQGRYLFPVIVPALCLFVLGVEGLVAPARRGPVVAALVVAVAALAVIATELVMLPAYAF